MISQNLEKITEKYNISAKNIEKRIIVCAGTGCIANGSLNVYNKLNEYIKETGLNVTVDFSEENVGCNQTIHLTESGCQGFCAQGPLVNILPEHILYSKVKIDDIQEIVNTSVIKNELVERLLYFNEITKKYDKGQNEIPFYKYQNRIVLGECGIIDPENILEYIAHGGYKAAQKVISDFTDKEICQTILDSGLRGRGGGGFLTGRKWELCRLQASEKKYLICNGDEGDPGAFMDRSLMEGNPHKIIEGMIIAAKAIGADEAYVYVRIEYPLAVKRMRKAIEDAEKMGFLGENIFDSNINLEIHIKEGAGAFVCGEETALMASIEGKRGMPKKRPPFPAESGLWNKPTNINNVETFANVPWIINNGAKAYASYGTEKSKGTKVFALTGKILNGGLVEVPMGITIHDIIFKLGGGMEGGKKFKAVQLGGPSGGCIPAYLDNTIVDYDSVTATGAIMGSGGMVVMDEETCMVDMARFFLDFTQKESCGKCTFCRIGTKRMLEILTRITEGHGKEGDIELLEELSYQIKDSSLCGLGQTAPNPVLTTIKYFREEYEAHIKNKKCPAKSCKALLTYEVVSEACTGCMVCAKKCPVQAIDGERKKVHFIRQADCTKCGECFSRCKFNAIKVY